MRRLWTLRWEATGIVCFLLAWEISGRHIGGADEQLFAPFSSALRQLWLLVNEDLLEHLLVSLRPLLTGYAAAVVVGLGVGVIFARAPWTSRMFGALVAAAYVTPLIALTPLIITALGLGVLSKFAIVFLLAVFPIIINTESGLNDVNPDYIDTAYAFNASKLQVLVKVTLPAASAMILTGLRLASGRAIIGIVVAELFGSTKGLGFLLQQFADAFQSARLLAVVMLLALLGLAANYGLLALERRWSPWRRRSDDAAA